MVIVQRPFSGEPDKTLMSELACRFASQNLHVVDLPYRLSSWALDDPGNASLWFDERERLVAWAVLQSPFWTVDYAYDPCAAPDLHRSILAWADRRAASLAGSPHARPAWHVMAFADQAERIGELEGAGFACQAAAGEDSWSKVLMRRPARAAAAECPVPAGYILRPLAGASEVDAYVALHRAVFESRNMTAEWRARTLRHPGYRPELDLVAVAPDGGLAAFCICWLGDEMAGGPSGQVEPLGVHPDHRRLGLGRAILAEGVRRLHLAGARQIYVETDDYRDAARDLYEWGGFRVLKDVLVYRKDYGGE